MKKRLLFLTLPLYLLTLSGCEKDLSNKRYIVHFDANTDVANNGTTDVSIRHGHRAKKPNLYSIDETKQNYVVFGWYQEKEFKNEWVFKKNIVTSDLTLYAKWGYEYNINYYLGNNLITPAYT